MGRKTDKPLRCSSTKLLSSPTNLKSEELVSFAYLLSISGTFNSLSKVLFTFPSQYLFAIGLESIFSFTGKLPRILRSSSKERDSNKTHRTLLKFDDRRDSHTLCRFLPKRLTPGPSLATLIKTTIQGETPGFTS